MPVNHLARLVVEIVDNLDLPEIERDYGNNGTQAYHPSLLLSVIFYGYATYNSVAFRFAACDAHPDHDTLNAFRERFLEQIEALMVQVLVLARTMGVLKLGNIALDGSKIKANPIAKAKIEARAQQRFDIEQAEFEDKVAKREEKAAQTGKKPRGKPPVAPAPPNADTGSHTGSHARHKDQINLTDEQSRIMKTSGGGFEQCYNG